MHSCVHIDRYACTYVFMLTSMHDDMYVGSNCLPECMHIWADMQESVCLILYVCRHTCMGVYMLVWMCEGMYACIYVGSQCLHEVYIYVGKHARAYICMATCMYACRQIWMSLYRYGYR